MKFPYIKLPSLDSQLKWTARPYIPIRLIWLNKIWEGYALIDSGADRSLFNIQIAQDLGLNFDEEQFENFGGIEGGVLKARLHKIKMYVNSEIIKNINKLKFNAFEKIAEVGKSANNRNERRSRNYSRVY